MALVKGPARPLFASETDRTRPPSVVMPYQLPTSISVFQPLAVVPGFSTRELEELGQYQPLDLLGIAVIQLHFRNTIQPLAEFVVDRRTEIG